MKIGREEGRQTLHAGHAAWWDGGYVLILRIILLSKGSPRGLLFLLK